MMFAGLPQGQEIKKKKRQKSGKNGVFEKKSGNLKKLKIFSTQIYKNP